MVFINQVKLKLHCELYSRETALEKTKFLFIKNIIVIHTKIINSLLVFNIRIQNYSKGLVMNNAKPTPQECLMESVCRLKHIFSNIVFLSFFICVFYYSMANVEVFE